MSKTKSEETLYIPDIIKDPTKGISYKKGRFFGKGGFARCYEIIDLATNNSYAGKIVSKKLLVKESQREKMFQEIQIHKSLTHKNVVGFYSFLEDRYNIYIVLELCRKRSMMELHQRRKAITEPEARYYMKQILSGVNYLHSVRIIHRDLKLGNLFLNDETQLMVKIGDFGLAAKIDHEGERKKTLCGTPNYIAPEILKKEGHSFEVDIWSLGCILYTLLIGRPPFETSSLKETYSKIQRCDYKISATVCKDAKHMIMIMLQTDPLKRPKVQQLMQHSFMINGYCPQALPVSCLTMAPRFDKVELGRKPLLEINNGEPSVLSPCKQPSIGNGLAPLTTPDGKFNSRESLTILREMLLSVIKTKPARKQKILDEMTDPAAQPTVWVSKWVDYSDKYGFGYQLSDEGVGVMFNDTTKLIMLPNGINVHYIDKNGEESYMTVDNYPKQYDKKMKLLSYFSRYMKEHLIKTGASVARESDTMSRTPHLYQWCRSTSGVLMQLNNGTIQMNFSDHTKIIMCPLMAAITYIDENKSFKTFKFTTIEKHGCCVALYEKIRYAFDKLTILQESDK